MTNKQEQVPFTTSQIENERPAIKRSNFQTLSGHVGGSFNAGHNHVLGWKQVMPGERAYKMTVSLNLQTLTPLTPAYQNVKVTARVYKVPDSRVWKGAEKFTAQKGGVSEIKIEKVPNTAGKYLYNMVNYTNEGIYTSIVNTTAWRDSYIGQYYPRLGRGGLSEDSMGEERVMPEVDILLLRGRKAIYNDLERNKEYDEEIKEYFDDTVSNEEWNSYIPSNEQNLIKAMMRAKKDNSYYSDYRSELQGFGEKAPLYATNEESFEKWLEWENKAAEARAQAQNAQKTDWEIISEIYGSKKLTEGKVELIGQKTFNLNYSSITQSTYNTSDLIDDEFKVMGKQGGYSYTNVEIPLFSAFEFNEPGYIHIIITASADTVYEQGWDRTILNTSWQDRYRPDMIEEKNDVLYQIETGSATLTTLSGADYKNVLGFKRKYSELFKLPNCINGDMTTNNYQEIEISGTGGNTALQADDREEVITQKTFQFYQTDGRLWLDHDSGNALWLKPWKDYSDLIMNRNQAIKNSIQMLGTSATDYDYRIKGQNQIIYVGVINYVCDLPVDESIKNNYTSWGEH